MALSVGVAFLGERPARLAWLGGACVILACVAVNRDLGAEMRAVEP